MAKQVSDTGDELMVLNNGKTPLDGYFSSTVYPWRVGDRSSLFFKARETALAAVLDEICHLPEHDLAKIKAVTTLGEVHHQFPNFQQGMGYDSDYEISDYSQRSIAQFQQWLATKFGSIDRLNVQLGADYTAFSDVFPPSQDIRTQSLSSFFEHIDPYAHGVMPFFGWAYAKDGSPFEVNVYLDGQFLGCAQTGMTRVDVAQALPELDHSNVGYRYDLDFSHLSPGRHTVELRFYQNGLESRLNTYDFAVVNRSQSTPRRIQGFHLAPAALDVNDNIRFWADHPETTVGVYFNPSWDPTLFAASDSLKKNTHYNLGINLYGGIVSNNAFFEWLERQHHDQYGLPEMHPMLPQEPGELARAWQRHHEQGAVFLSPYFMSLVPKQFATDPAHDRFKLDSTNSEYGSDQFYRSIEQLFQ